MSKTAEYVELFRKFVESLTDIAQWVCSVSIFQIHTSFKVETCSECANSILPCLHKYSLKYLFSNHGCLTWFASLLNMELGKLENTISIPRAHLLQAYMALKEDFIYTCAKHNRNGSLIL